MGPSLPFVTATHPSQFKDKQRMRIVRKTAMNHHISTRKPTDTAKPNDEVAETLADSREAADNKRHEGDPSAFQSSWRLPPPSPPPDESDLLTISEVTPPSSIDTINNHGSQPSDAGVSSLSSPLVTLERSRNELAELAYSVRRLHLADDPADCRHFIQSKWPKESATRHHANTVFDSALAHEPQQTIQSSSGCSSGPVPVANLDLLKIICGAFYSSYQCNQKWTALLLESPEAYFTALCIVAPFADLLTHPQPLRSTIPWSHSRQTLEILDVVPQMINDRLSDPQKQSDDQTIIAIAQLLSSQLSTSHDEHVSGHRGILQEIITSRGGLAELGGNGEIANFVTIAELEASILKNVPTNASYLTWVNTRCISKDGVKTPCPESPVFCLGTGMTSVASDPLCYPETLKLILLMEEMTEVIVKLCHTTSQTRYALQTQLREVADVFHQMPPYSTKTTTKRPDWIYRSIWLAASKWTHAALHRRPLHDELRCEIKLTNGSRCSSHAPDMILGAIRQTDLDGIWGNLAGVLHWTLLVAAASAYEPNRVQYLESSMSPNAHHQRSAGSSVSPIMVEGMANSQDDIMAVDMPTKDFGLPSAALTYSLITPPRGDLDEQTNSAAADYNRRYWEYTTARNDSSYPFPSNIQSTPQSGHTQYTSSQHFPSSHSSAPSLRQHTPAFHQTSRTVHDEEGLRWNDYLKQFFTTHAIRVSILLRFEHPVAVIQGLARMEQCTAWLRGDG